MLIIGDRVKELRGEESQAELAARISTLCGFNVKWQSIQQLEKGRIKKMPRYATWLPLALKTSMEYLRGQTNIHVLQFNDHLKNVTEDRLLSDTDSERDDMPLTTVDALLSMVADLSTRLSAVEREMRGSGPPEGKPPKRSRPQMPRRTS